VVGETTTIRRSATIVQSAKGEQMGKRLTRAEYHNAVCNNGCVCDRWSSIKRRICVSCDDEKYHFEFEYGQRICQSCKKKVEEQWQSVFLSQSQAQEHSHSTCSDTMEHTQPTPKVHTRWTLRIVHLLKNFATSI